MDNSTKNICNRQHKSPASKPLIDGWAPYLEEEENKYVSIANAIEKGIKSGLLKSGMQLPPQRKIAEYFGVTIATVTKAINLAANRGIVIARVGSGTFITETAYSSIIKEKPLENVESTLSQENKDLSLNAPPVPVVLDLLQENLRELRKRTPGKEIFDYEPIPGHLDNREAAAYWMSLRGMKVAPKQILMTQGAHEGLLISLSAFTKPGDIILCENLNYTGLRRIGQILGIKLIGVNLTKDGMCPAELEKSIRQHQPKAIVCTPVSHNPTTLTYSQENLMQLGRLAQANNIPVIEDDIYGHYGKDSTTTLAERFPKNTILITSLSKTVAAGIRIGYIVAPERMKPKLQDEMFNLGWTAASFQAAFATLLIFSGRALECLDRHNKEAFSRLNIARQILGKALRTPSVIPTYHIWVDTGPTRPSDLSAELYRQGILVSPASHFVIDDDRSPHALRLSLGRTAKASELYYPLELIAHRLRDSDAAMLGSIV